MVRVLDRGFLLVGLLGSLALAVASGCASPEDEISSTPFGSGGSAPLGGGSSGGSAPTGGIGPGGAAPTGGTNPSGGGVAPTGGVGAAPATGGLGAVPATGGAASGGGGTSGWDVGAACDNTQQPPCGDTDMWCDGGACTCGTGQFCAETGACYWEGSTCP